MRPMTSKDVPHITTYFLKQYGLYKKGWRFKWDNACRRCGCCKHGKRLITISRNYAKLNEHQFDEVLDTILHEIAHALVGSGHGHDDTWKAMYVKVGAKPQRCADATTEMPKGKYVARCLSCGKVYRKHKVTKRGRYYYCPPCGEVSGLLIFKLDPVVSPPKPTAPPTMPNQDMPPPPPRLRGT